MVGYTSDHIGIQLDFGGFKSIVQSVQSQIEHRKQNAELAHDK